MKKLNILASVLVLLINFSAIAIENLYDTQRGTCTTVDTGSTKSDCWKQGGRWVEANNGTCTVIMEYVTKSRCSGHSIWTPLPQEKS